jgi:hypothetical protein
MYADVIVAITALALLVYLFYGPWQSVCTDFARQIIFESRDSLFDLAREGKLDFKSQQYRSIRSSLETLIRFAHDVSIPYMACHFSRKIMDVRENKLEASISSIEDQATKAAVYKLVDKAHKAILVMLIFKSIIAILAMLVALVVLAVGPVRRLLGKKINYMKRFIQNEAEIYEC